MSSVSIALTDVTLRDGLQMEKRVMKTPERVALFKKIAACGFERVEITSFVSPKWVPQFKDSDAFCKSLFKKGDLAVETMAFVPNVKGLDRLLAFPIPWAAAFVAASPAFNQTNVNATVEQSLATLVPIVERVRREKRRVRIYISTVFGCPYQGEVTHDDLDPVFRAVAALDPDEIALGDTIGVAVPEQVKKVLVHLAGYYPVDRTSLHLHDTYGLGIVSAQIGYKCGVRKFDGTLGGIGGCPYAKGASGNTALEGLAYAFHRQGLYPSFAGPEMRLALAALKKSKLKLHSRLADILARGGKWHGVA